MQTKNFTSFIITEDDCNRRIDRVLRKFLKDLPLSFIYAALRKSTIRLNGKRVKNNYIVQLGDSIELHNSLFSEKRNLLSSKKNKPSKLKTRERRANLDSSNDSEKAKITALPAENVLFRDKNFLVLNKKRFSVVQGRGSLDEIVKAEYARNNSTPSLSFKPGPLHRLDAGTSGIVFFSQSLKASQVFSKALHDGKLLRFYVAIVQGRADDSACFTSPVAGKKACTKSWLVKYYPEKNVSLVKIQILSGRKHQIRIHFAKNALPLLGDGSFGASVKNEKNAYFLHFYKMQFSEKVLSLPEQIYSPIPSYFFEVLGETNFEAEIEKKLR